MEDKVKIRWVDETDSTQDELRRRFPEHDNLSVTAAVFQTAGRGQRGNRWTSGRGLNLTFSMLLKFGEGGFPALGVSRQFEITKAATLGVVSYLEGKGVEPSIKWPNDIYVRDKKICGMLVENVLDGDKLSHSFVGIGLNMNQREFDPSLTNPVSLSKLTGEEYDLKPELETLASLLAESFRRFLGEGGAALPDDREYENRLYRKGRFHDYVSREDGKVFEGKIIGVSPEGKLLVVNRKGELNEFAFKEINFII